jgi:hypothetical protein
VRIVATRAIAIGHRLVKHRQAGAGTDIVMAVGAELPLVHPEKHRAWRTVRVMAYRTIVLSRQVDHFLSRRHRIFMTLHTQRPRICDQQLGMIAPMTAVARRAVLGGRVGMALGEIFCDALVARPA